MKLKNLKKPAILFLGVFIIILLYMGYETYRVVEVKALLRNISVESIQTSFARQAWTFGHDTDSRECYFTNENEIQEIMGILQKTKWKYHRKELNSVTNASQSISCDLYIGNYESITIDFTRGMRNYYVTVRGEQNKNYGAFIISLEEGDVISDMLFKINRLI